MADVIISPNMQMPVPIVGQDPGEDWANNVNACLSAIDIHNHTAGQGVPITPAAININADLAMNNNNLISIRTARFQVQTSTPSDPSDLGELFVLGADLYYIDVAGNVVRITQGGNVTGATGTITGLPSGTASASFAAGTFTFQQATNTPASMNFGPIKIGQPVSSGFGVTISPAVSQAANYALSLPPALPTVTSLVATDTSGNLSFVPVISGSYTPLVTSTGPGTGQSAIGTFFYQRIGNNVTVTGNLAGNALPSLGSAVTLPIAPSVPFVNTYDLVGGSSGFTQSGVVNSGDTLMAEVGGLRAIVQLNYATSTAVPTYTIQFTYSCA